MGDYLTEILSSLLAAAQQLKWLPLLWPGAGLGRSCVVRTPVWLTAILASVLLLTN